MVLYEDHSISKNRLLYEELLPITEITVSSIRRLHPVTYISDHRILYEETASIPTELFMRRLHHLSPLLSHAVNYQAFMCLFFLSRSPHSFKTKLFSGHLHRLAQNFTTL